MTTRASMSTALFSTVTPIKLRNQRQSKRPYSHFQSIPEMTTATSKSTS